MKISDITAAFRDSLKTAFPDADVTDSKTIQQAIERVATASGRPVITLTPGRRDPAQLAGSMGSFGGVARQSVQIYIGAAGGIAKRGEARLALADLAAEVESAALSAEGDWDDPRWDGSEPASLPDGYPLDAWLIRVSVLTSQFSTQPETP
jgi:hypothetical protein